MVVYPNLQVVMHPQVALSLPNVINLNLQVPFQLHRFVSPNIDAMVFEHLVLIINLLFEFLTREFFSVS